MGMTIADETINEKETAALDVFQTPSVLGNTEDSNFIISLLSSKRKKVQLELEWVPSSSNNCERLFSKSRHLLNDQRNRLEPENLEYQIFLQANGMSKCSIKL